MILEAVFKEEAEMKADFGSGFPIGGKADYSIVANALKGTVSGALVSMKDVSPLDHNIKVKLTSDTITDFSSVTLKKYGKNLFDINSTLYNAYFAVNQDGTNTLYRATDSACFFILCTPNATYTVSHSNYANNIFRIGYIKEKGLEDVGQKSIIVYSPIRGTTEKKHTITTGEGATYIVVQVTLGTVEATRQSLQCEVGNSATEYEPYKEPETVFVNEDGTASVIGNGESTTLVPDTAGVTITAEYNRDLNKAFAEIYQAIATMGAATATIHEEV